MVDSIASLLPYLVSIPLLPLSFLTFAVLTLSTLAAADTTPKERQEQRIREEAGEAVVLKGTHAVLFVVMASAGLLAMWMWADVLIYISLFTFALGSFVSMQQWMPRILAFVTGYGNNEGKQSIPSWVTDVFSALVVVAWFWFRNSSGAWILQDVLGGFVITLMLSILKPASMSSPTFLLLMAFFYDVFFVFVTPHLTTSGESIMEAAATGASMTVKETIPMLFRVPGKPGVTGEAMLGFGDIVLPGILITFLRECDARLAEPCRQSLLSPSDSPILSSSVSAVQSRKPWGYHTIAVTGYMVGLEVTFMAMMWSSQGQPALLYLAPSILIPVIYVAAKRHELTLLWNGWEEETEDLDNEDEEDDNEDKVEEEKEAIVSLGRVDPAVKW